MTGTVPPSLVVLGPTASGKSEVAMSAARQRAGRIEILAVDSMQVYRGMDVGTAKPTAADRVAVPHHGIDLVDADVDFTVADFAAAGRAALADIAERGRRALLVAGTGLYLRALTDPMDLPGRWPSVRAELEESIAARPGDGVARLHARLDAVDPVAASRIEPGNARRIVRALEVVLGSGRPFSSYGDGIATFPPVPFAQVGLRWERAALAGRIADRVHRMLDAGLVDEVANLAASPGLSRTARQALGYKEVLDHLDGRGSLDEATAAIITRTRQFGVRQERWFRRDPRIRWISVHDDPVAEVLPMLEQA